MKGTAFFVFLLFIICLMSVSALAADKVVVIPLSSKVKITGSDGQILYNDNGEVAGSEMTYDKGTVDVKVPGEIHSSSTGTANMEPIAFGMLDKEGTVKRGTGNFTCSWNSTSERYEIIIEGENYFFTNYATIVTPAIPAVGPYMFRTASGGGKLLIYFYDTSEAYVQSDFSFVTYKP